jgi:type VI secretion system secreted protein Hcp
MAVDMFLKIDGIQGESTDHKHDGAIELMSFSWGVTQTGANAFGGGGATGKAQFQDFHFSSNTSKASPKIMLACASGTHIKKAELFCRKAGGDSANGGLEFLKLTFTDVLVSSFQQSGGGDVPTESISFNFGKIEFEYTPQNADGTAGAPVMAGWDVKANKKV